MGNIYCCRHAYSGPTPEPVHSSRREEGETRWDDSKRTMSLFQNYFLTTIVADLLAEAVTLLCCRYIGPIPLLCKSIRGIMNKGLAPSLNSVGMFLRAKIFRLYQGFVIKGINHTGQIFLNRPSVSSCVRHGCNPLERFSSDWGDLSEQGSVMRGLTILHKSLIKSLY